KWRQKNKGWPSRSCARISNPNLADFPSPAECPRNRAGIRYDCGSLESRRPFVRALKITLLSLAGLVLAAALCLVVIDRMDQPPAPDFAALIAKAKQYDVHIKRDGFGVPHVIGPRDADVAFGLGFAQSEDDFATVQQVALASRGQLAATQGRQ